MNWDHPHDVFFIGFRDGYKGVTNRKVEKLHNHYERGFVSGAMERRYALGLDRKPAQEKNGDPVASGNSGDGLATAKGIPKPIKR